MSNVNNKLINYYNQKGDFLDKLSKEKLLELLAEKCMENEKLRGEISDLGWQYEELMKRRVEVRKLRECVEFYDRNSGTIQSYIDECDDEDDTEYVDQFLSKARKTLKEIEQ